MAKESFGLHIAKDVTFVVPLFVFLHCFVGLEDFRAVGALHGKFELIYYRNVHFSQHTSFDWSGHFPKTLQKKLSLGSRFAMLTLIKGKS
jgi:hypothetical protein